jgi:hypothetical protein
VKVPGKLKILGHDVEVRLVSDKDIPGATGDFHTQYMLIRINQQGAKSDIEQTLLHEIIEMASAMLELALEHRQVQALSEVLYQVLKDNRLKFFDDEDQ